MLFKNSRQTPGLVIGGCSFISVNFSLDNDYELIPDLGRERLLLVVTVR